MLGACVKQSHPGNEPAPPPLTVPPEDAVPAEPAELPPAEDPISADSAELPPAEDPISADPAKLPPSAAEASSEAAVAGLARFTAISSGLAFVCCPGKAAEVPVPRSA